MFDAYQGLIIVYLERGRDVKRAKRALALARLHLVRRSKSHRRQAEATYDYYDGWISYQQGHIKAAYEKLEQSLRQWQAPKMHYRLGIVCLARAQAPKTSAAQKAHWLGRARDHCASALAIDLRGAFVDRVAALEDQIAKAA
jgi:hypothetical protein